MTDLVRPQLVAAAGAGLVLLSYTVVPWGSGRGETYLDLRSDLVGWFSDGDFNAQLQAFATKWGVLLVIALVLTIAGAIQRMGGPTRFGAGVLLAAGVVNHQAIIGTLTNLSRWAYLTHVGLALIAVALMWQPSESNRNSVTAVDRPEAR